MRVHKESRRKRKGQIYSTAYRIVSLYDSYTKKSLGTSSKGSVTARTSGQLHDDDDDNDNGLVTRSLLAYSLRMERDERNRKAVVSNV